MLSLSQLQAGQMATVQSIPDDNPLKARLQDLGLIDGTIVRCVLKSTFGDPAAFFFRGATIALRQKETDSIAVQLIPSTTEKE